MWNNQECSKQYLCFCFVWFLVGEFGSVWVGDKVGLRYVVSVSFIEPQAVGSSGVALWFGGAPSFSQCL